jgi:hypothetical protein
MPVFQAEVFAILACVHDIISHGIPNKHVSIFSDSLAALKALGAVRTSPLFRQYQEALNEISALAEYTTNYKKITQLPFITKRFISYIVSFHVFVIFQTVCLRLFEGNLLSVTFSADRQTLYCSSYDYRYLLTDSAKGDKTDLMGKATNLD